MTFFERYTRICEQRGIEPCSQRAADTFGVTRSTISSWGRKNASPKGETVAVIATALHVSTDYLLGRTDDQTDYADEAVKAMCSNLLKDQTPDVLRLYYRLDDTDRAKAEGIIQGMLLNEKYKAEI